MTMPLNKGMMRNSVDPDKPRVLILNPTGVVTRLRKSDWEKFFSIE